jgi:hypothetical protein
VRELEAPSELDKLLHVLKMALLKATHPLAALRPALRVFGCTTDAKTRLWAAALRSLQ